MQPLDTKAAGSGFSDQRALDAQIAPPENRTSGRVCRALLALIFALYTVIVLFTFHQMEEDAFIYFRFATNISQGNGYVFNDGGERIESGSSLVWQLIMVPVAALPGNMILKTKLLSFGFGILALLILKLISDRVITDPLLRLIPLLLLTASTSFYCWSQRGLESPLYLSVVLLMCLVMLSDRWRQHWHIVGFVLFCSRPEAFLVLFAAFPLVLLYREKIDHFWLKFLWVTLLCGAVTIARLLYFHDPVPHPFYIKMPGLAAFGTTTVTNYLRDNYLFLLAAPLLAGAATRRFWSKETLTVTLFATITLTWAFMSIDNRAYARHLLPALPFLFILTARAGDVLIRGRRSRHAVRAVFFVFAGLMLFLSNTTYQHGTRRNPFTSGVIAATRSPTSFLMGRWHLLTDLDGYEPSRFEKLSVFDVINTNFQATTGKFLNLNYPTGMTVVYDQMGQTPWYAGMNTTFVDSFGLITKKVGYWVFGRRVKNSAVFKAYDQIMRQLSNILPGAQPRSVSRAEALEHLFDRDPEIVMVNLYLAEHANQSLAHVLERHPRMLSGYRPAFELSGMVRVYERLDVHANRPLRIPSGLRLVELDGSPLFDPVVVFVDGFESSDARVWSH